MNATNNITTKTQLKSYLKSNQFAEYKGDIMYFNRKPETFMVHGNCILVYLRRFFFCVDFGKRGSSGYCFGDTSVDTSRANCIDTLLQCINCGTTEAELIEDWNEVTTLAGTPPAGKKQTRF